MREFFPLLCVYMMINYVNTCAKELSDSLERFIANQELEMIHLSNHDYSNSGLRNNNP